MSAAIEVRGLSRAFRSRGGSVEALRSIDLLVEDGEFVAITGPNGSGKTTLLRILATVLEPSSGRALVLGHDVVLEPRPVRAAIGVSLGSDRSFLWRLTARQNLAFLARLRGLGGARLRRELSCAAGRAGVLRHLGTPVGRLAAGVRARLRLAGALLGRPAVLILDEPLGGLDVRGRTDAAGVLAAEAARGTTVLAATHDPVLIEAASARVVLRRGRIGRA